MDGKDIWPLIEGKEKQYYDHVTCAWGPVVMVRNQRWWYNAYLWGKTPLLFDLSNDPKLENNAATEYPEVCEEMKKLAITKVAEASDKASNGDQCGHKDCVMMIGSIIP